MIILASSSPRRRELIGALGLDVDVVPSGADEDIDTSLGAEEQASSLAKRKAAQVAAAHPGTIVLGADTIVMHGGEVLNKPIDRSDAERMLRRLRGVDHLVHTGLAVVAPGHDPLTAVGDVDGADAAVLRGRACRLRADGRIDGQGRRLRNSGRSRRNCRHGRGLLHERGGVAALHGG